MPNAPTRITRVRCPHEDRAYPAAAAPRMRSAGSILRRACCKARNTGEQRAWRRHREQINTTMDAPSCGTPQEDGTRTAAHF